TAPSPLSLPTLFRSTPQWFQTPPAEAPDWDVTALMPWQPPGANDEVLVVGGVFQSIGTSEFRLIATWDGDNWANIGGGLWGGNRSEEHTAELQSREN